MQKFVAILWNAKNLQQAKIIFDKFDMCAKNLDGICPILHVFWNRLNGVAVVFWFRHNGSRSGLHWTNSGPALFPLRHEVSLCILQCHRPLVVKGYIAKNFDADIFYFVGILLCKHSILLSRYYNIFQIFAYFCQYKSTPLLLNRTTWTK